MSKMESSSNLLNNFSAIGTESGSAKTCLDGITAIGLTKAETLSQPPEVLHGSARMPLAAQTSLI
jgi:hypothetical protein